MVPRQALLGIFFVRTASATLLGSPRAKALLAGRVRAGGPDEDNYIRELHDNAEYKTGKKPTDALEKDFVSVDRDHDGKLEESELMFRQYATGCEPVEAQVRGHDYLRCGDLNKDGTISLDEFKASTQPAWINCIKNSGDRRVHGFVRFFDADMDFDGKLSKTELRVGVLQLWGEPGEELVEPLMGCADKNKDGFLDEDEFHNSIAAYNPATRSWQMWNGTSDPSILDCMKDSFKKFDAALVFAASDTNKDRKLSRQEAYNTMRAVNGIALPQATADAIFDAADKDKNKFLNLEEFTTAGEAHKGANEASFFLTGRGSRGKAPGNMTSDMNDEGYGMSLECHNADGSAWRIFSESMGRVRVNTTDTAGGVKVTQR